MLLSCDRQTPEVAWLDIEPGLMGRRFRPMQWHASNAAVAAAAILVSRLPNRGDNLGPGWGKRNTAQTHDSVKAMVFARAACCRRAGSDRPDGRAPFPAIRGDSVPQEVGEDDFNPLPLVVGAIMSRR